jgi:diphthine synthase
MLWVIGLGIHGARGIGFNSLEVLNNCNLIYVERYTCSITDTELKNLASLIDPDEKKSISLVQRWFLEDGREILENAKDKEVALLTYGDPLIATTHVELLVRAVKNSIQVKIIHAASGLCSLVGEIGLHVYKFGRTVTITSEPQSVVSVYGTILDNLILGSHTMILTEFENRNGEDFFLDPGTAFSSLLESERHHRSHACHEETFAVVVSRIGTTHQSMVSGKIRSLMDLDYGIGPHTIVVTGFLHFSEIDALKTLTRNVDSPSDNTLYVQNKSASMVERYVPKAKNAVSRIRTLLENKSPTREKKRLNEIVENTEYYIEDAIRFLKTGRPELALLSIGYAEGLLDAVGINKQLELWD